MSVSISRDGPVTVIAIDRPGRRNAVDAATARERDNAFKAEIGLGLETLASGEAVAGATRFSGGEGRGGQV